MPATPEETFTQLKNRGLSFADGIDKVNLVAMRDDKTLNLMMPTKAQVEHVIDKIENTNSYALPDDIIDFATNPGNFNTPELKLGFFRCRFGDYTLQHCAS